MQHLYGCCIKKQKQKKSSVLYTAAYKAPVLEEKEGEERWGENKEKKGEIGRREREE